MSERIQMQTAKKGLHAQIDLEQQDDGWHAGYLVSLGACSLPWDYPGGSSYSDGIGHPIGTAAFETRREALETAVEMIRIRLPKLGLDHSDHNKRRQYINRWLDTLTPAQMELF